MLLNIHFEDENLKFIDMMAFCGFDGKLSSVYCAGMAMNQWESFGKGNGY